MKADLLVLIVRKDIQTLVILLLFVVFMSFMSLWVEEVYFAALYRVLYKTQCSVSCEHTRRDR
jgi:hypothetical protein